MIPPVTAPQAHPAIPTPTGKPDANRTISAGTGLPMYSFATQNTASEQRNYPER